MPVIDQTKVVPDLLYYIEQYVKSSSTNKYQIPFPSTFPVDYLYDNKSFIRLLFDENWPKDYTNYRYYFREETCFNHAYETLKTRMHVHDGSEFYICDSDTTAVGYVNIFGLEQIDLDMLDILLQYRLDSTSVDTTSIVYVTLTTPLSKLIYHYLNFKIHHQFTIFDTTIPISPSNKILENFYESYIVDQIFIYLSTRGRPDPVQPVI